MEHMWAPWRMEFILNDKPTQCILCQKPAENDDEGNLILHRGKLNFVILNKYPYNPGHLMVAPYRHIATLEDMSDEEILDHFTMVRKCTKALRSMLEPAGFNIGITLGKIAGAGISDHAHTHTQTHSRCHVRRAGLAAARPGRPAGRDRPHVPE